MVNYIDNIPNLRKKLGIKKSCATFRKVKLLPQATITQQTDYIV